MKPRQRTIKSANSLLGGLLFCSGLAVSMPVFATDSLSVCAEPSSKGPNLYWRSAPAASGGQELVGFAKDLLTLVERSIKTPLVLRTDLPFARCMQMVADGEVDFAVGIYRDAQRAQIYAFSKPYQTLRPQVFLSTGTSIRIEDVADLKKFRGCGMHGSSYAHYGLKPGELDQGTLTYGALKQKLMAGRCDYFVEELEVGARMDANGNYSVEPGLRHNDIKGAKPPGRHLITAKGGNGAKWIPAINNAIDQATRSGELHSLWLKHINLAFASSLPSVTRGSE
jgi:polar amino acid transport system substrate-binding protein